MTQDFELPSIPDSLRIHLYDLEHSLSLPELAWSSRFLQPNWNFLNHLLTVWWSTGPSPLAQQIFLVVSTMLKCSSNSSSICSLIRHCFTFNCVAIKSPGVKQCTTCQCTNYHSTTKHSRYSLNFFCHVIYLLQASTYQNIGKLLTHPNIKLWTWQAKFKPWTRLFGFHIALIPLGKVWIQQFSLQLWVNSRADWAL